MKYLEKVEIGDDSFGTSDNGCSNRYGRFVLKDCPLLKSFSTSSRAFSVYNSCVIENLPMLESLSIGGAYGSNNYCGGFRHASLELKSVVLEV